MITNKIGLISDPNIANEIHEIKKVILATVPTLQIYLFGSFVNGKPHKDSDFDFYVVIPDNTIRPFDAMREISAALRGVQNRPIDMLVGEESKFNKYKNVYSIEKEVVKTGIKLYG